MNIILVDDNPYIIEGLRAGIDYASLGIEEVFEASSMAMAIEIIQKHVIDIALTDIEMPNGTGLDLLEWINENKPGIVTMFCTSYADFDYAKKAIQLHCFEYYLKPIEYEKLYELLKKAVKEVNRIKEEQHNSKLAQMWLQNEGNRKNHFWSDVLLNIFTYPEDDFEELALSRHLDYSNTSYFTICLLKFQEDNDKLEKIDFVIQTFILQNVLQEMFQLQHLVLEGMLKSDQEGLWIVVLSQQDSRDEHTLADISDLFAQVVANCGEVLHCPAAAIFSYHKKLNEIRSRYLELEETCEHAVICMGQAYDYHDLKLQSLNAHNEKETWTAVDTVKQYLDEHYNEDITREGLGQMAYHNSAYLAKMFKQYVGMSMGNYLLEKRIEKACELLKYSDQSVSEISLSVGYDNMAYFSRLFKKRTGVTPSEYRVK